MLEKRKQKEIEYYDKKAEEFLGEKFRENLGIRDFEGFQPQNLSSFRFLYHLLKENCQDKIILDYGCGNGIHTIPLTKMGAEKVIGIDLSEKSLEIAKERVKREWLAERVEFILMDCEKMEFPDDSFDIIFDSGTLYALNLKKAIPEILRVLKPGGVLIGVETLGHNPFTNLKRKINKLFGKRTAWALTHILKIEDLEYIKEHFKKSEFYFFHIVSWFTFPFLNLPGGQFALKLFELIDRTLLNFPFLRKYAFKVVFIFLQPRK